MSYLKSKKGFTLMEMLIVVAIIAILVAIAIPVFTAQLETARERVDEANLRTAESMAVAAYMLDDEAGAVTYYAMDGEDSTLTVQAADAKPGTGTYAPQSGVNDGLAIAITVEDGDVTEAEWK